MLSISENNSQNSRRSKPGANIGNQFETVPTIDKIGASPLLAWSLCRRVLLQAVAFATASLRSAFCSNLGRVLSIPI